MIKSGIFYSRMRSTNNRNDSHISKSPQPALPLRGLLRPQTPLMS